MVMKKSIITLGFLFLLTGTIAGQTTEPEPGYDGGSNEANIEQVGNYNIGNIGQIGSNSATIEQAGDNNRALVQQGGGKSLGSFGDTPVKNPFPGYFGEIGNLQSTSSADLIQNGDFNDAFVVQMGSHSAEITQDGADNQAAIVQIGTDFSLFPTRSGSSGTGSIASIIQHGNNNQAVVGQLGNSHNGTVEQYGNNNRATIAQLPYSGSLNGDNGDFYPGFGDSIGGSSGTIIQYGDLNEAVIIQNGGDVPTEIVQFGYESAVMVEHNGF